MKQDIKNELLKYIDKIEDDDPNTDHKNRSNIIGKLFEVLYDEFEKSENVAQRRDTSIKNFINKSLDEN